MDLDRCEALRTKQKQIVILVKKYAFFADKVPEKGVFVIEGMTVTPLFYAEDAVEHFKRHKLTGMDFKLVWEG